LPLFDSGRLNAQLGQARSSRDELLAEYNEAVLNAVRDVAREARHPARHRERDGSACRDHRSEPQAGRERRGAHGARPADRAAVQQARMAVLRQRDVELQLTDARLQTQVALVKALGGGYHATTPALTQSDTQ
jgi:multidrug efflux system outer membrane protein